MTVIFFKLLLTALMVVPIAVLGGFLLSNLLDLVLEKRKTDKK